MNLIYDKWGHLLTSLEQPILFPVNLLKFAQVMHEKGGALQNCWGFLDGTVRPVSRPGKGRGYFKIDTKKFITSSCNQLQHQMGLLQIFMYRMKVDTTIVVCWHNQDCWMTCNKTLMILMGIFFAFLVTQHTHYDLTFKLPLRVQL